MKNTSTDKDDKILINRITEADTQCFTKNIEVSTCFLDLRQQSLILPYLAKSKCRYVLFGGYEDAERRAVYFLPDYLEEPASDDLCILELTHGGYGSPSHRDYLGSVLGSGVERDVIGDIIVYDKGAQVIIKAHTARFLSLNVTSVGRCAVHAESKPLSALEMSAIKTKAVTDTVMSLRLDAICSRMFGIPRSDAAKAIEGGTVFINGALCTKSDKQVAEGDKIVMRGRGKGVLSEIGGTSKKGRTFITAEVYV